MNWDAIGAIGDIVGAFAVVVSLVYLAVQIRVQSKETQALAMHEISAAFRDSIKQYSENGAADIFIRAKNDIDSLDETERFQLFTSCQQVLRVWEEAYLMHKNGRLDDDMWIPMAKQFVSFMDLTHISYFWSLRKEFFNDKFRAYVDNCDVTEYKL